jgi:hypothetical protein
MWQRHEHCHRVAPERLYVPTLTVTGGWPSAVPSGGTIASLLTLAVVCTAVAFRLLFALVECARGACRGHLQR